MNRYGDKTSNGTNLANCPFPAGDTEEHGLNPKWKNMEWWQAGMLMLVSKIRPSLFPGFM
jgi:hypothetical protein